MTGFSSISRIRTMAWKEWLQIRRDTRSLILSLIAPVLLVLLFGYALTVDVKNVSTVIYDQDRSSFSGRFIENFSHTEYLKILKYVDNYHDLDRSIDSGDAILALVIPRGFERIFKSGGNAAIQVLADGSDSTSATIALGYIKAIVTQYNTDIMFKQLKSSGISSVEMPVDVKSRIWYNPELKSKNFIIPGLIVIVLAIISALIASLTISREWERGTMESLLTTPVRSSEIVLGKLVPYLFIGLFDIIMAVGVGYFVFDVPIKGSFVEFYIMALLFLVGTSTLGILISAATKVQVLSVQFAMVVTYLPSFLLSGFIFPINNMPLIIKAVTFLVPARYLIVLVKAITMKGVSVFFLWTQIIFLFAFASLMIFLSIRKLKLRLPEGGSL